MELRKIPETVEKALGRAAARDLENWLQNVIADTTQTQFPISAFVARQKVNGILLDQVSDMLMSGDPTLAQREDGKQVWRVPVYLTALERGRIGQVGTLDVEVQLGEFSFTPEDLSELADKAERLAKDSNL